MLSGKLWPAHPHPYLGECLSSWIVRTAHHNGLKVQTFSDIVFGKQHQIWNRDIDRLAPNWLLNAMSNHTGASLHIATKTTLMVYLHRLYANIKPSGVLRWVLPLVIHHRKRKAFGMQYCPLCLQEDKKPYFRIFWRLALYTFCPKHHVLLRDRCACGANVIFHRVELGKPHIFDADRLDKCWRCEELLSRTPSIKIELKPSAIFNIWTRLLGVFYRNFVNSGAVNYDRLILLHQVCKIISSVRFNHKIQRYICDKSGLPFLPISKRTYFEQYDINERHYILQLAWWLLGNTPAKLQEALNKKVLNVNYLYRDSSEPYLHQLFKV